MFTLMKSFFLGMLLTLSACSIREERFPSEQVMHYPYSLSLLGDTLMVSATSTDGKYDHGRLLSLNTDKIKNELNGTKKDPLPWGLVVETNVLSPIDTGKIVMTENAVTFTERQRGSLLALPMGALGPLCNDKNLRAEKCPNAATLNFFTDDAEQDTFGLMAIKTSKDEDTFLVTYLSSARIDIVSLNKQQSKLSLKKVRNFSGLELLKTRLADKNLAKRRAVTKAMSISFINTPDAKAYFLFELHQENNLLLKSPKVIYLASIGIKDLEDEKFSNATVEVMDLKEKFNIIGARDLYIDQAKNQLLLLATNPAGLFRIDLAKKSLITTNPVCSNADSMAVNPNLGLIVIPCMKDNRLQSYSFENLKLLNTSDFDGRFPASALIDEKHRLIYSSFFLDGIVGIFDLNLNFLGHLFNRAPLERLGS